MKEVDKINWCKLSMPYILEILYDAPCIKVDCKDWQRLTVQWPKLLEYKAYMDKMGMIKELVAFIGVDQ